jgi:hypothetical protein
MYWDDYMRTEAERWAAKAEEWARPREREVEWALSAAEAALSTTSGDECPLCDMGDQELVQGFCRLCWWEEKKKGGADCEAGLRARFRARFREAFLRDWAEAERVRWEAIEQEWAEREARRAAERATPAWRKAAKEAETWAWWGRRPVQQMSALYVRFDRGGAYHDRFFGGVA